MRPAGGESKGWRILRGLVLRTRFAGIGTHAAMVVAAFAGKSMLRAGMEADQADIMEAREAAREVVRDGAAAKTAQHKGGKDGKENGDADYIGGDNHHGDGDGDAADPTSDLGVAGGGVDQGSSGRGGMARGRLAPRCSVTLLMSQTMEAKDAANATRGRGWLLCRITRRKRRRKKRRKRRKINDFV